MSFLAAVTGKGGVGKTTVSALIIKALIESGKKPVLAIDADPNTCLDISLGVKAATTIGSVREDTKKLAAKGMAEGMAKHDLLELKISESLVETSDFDLLAMGRPEGPGCYCFANNVVKEVLSRLSAQYPFIVLDNEAGLENLSRRIVRKVDLMVIVADHSATGLLTVKRLHALAHEMGTEYDKLVIVVNRVRTDSPTARLEDLGRELGASATLSLPDNDEIRDFAENGRSLLSLTPSNSVASGISRLLSRALGTAL